MPQQTGAQTAQLAYAPMASIEDFQPVQPTRRPRPPFGSGCFRILLRAAVGFFGGAAAVIAALSVLKRRVTEGAMVQPYTTTGGTSVQLPVWERINSVLLEIFGD